MKSRRGSSSLNDREPQFMGEIWSGDPGSLRTNRMSLDRRHSGEERTMERKAQHSVVRYETVR